MGKPPQGKIKIRWSPEFAYAIGLLTTDGNLSSDRRHMSLVSKDMEQILNFKKCLELKVVIGKSSNGKHDDQKYYRVQFGDVIFFRFLISIGLHPKKSKTLREIMMPKKYFFDFLRGHFDGDGCFYSYWDKRWKSSFMFYTVFVSASKEHIDWLRTEIASRLKIHGHVTKAVKSSVYQLKYAKGESLRLLPEIYYDRQVVCLSRKRIKIEKFIKLPR